MIITLHDILHLKIDDSLENLNSICDNFTLYVPNYYHMNLYKMGRWDGKIRLFNTTNQTLPYGLLNDLIKYYKKVFPNEKIKISNDVTSIYKGIDLKPTYNLSKEPFYYQKDCIETALKYSKGLIRSATASGKSLTIAYIIKTLIENELSKHSIIVVPTISLVLQFQKDLIEYGIDRNLIGLVYENCKDFNKEIVISTWQSLMKNHRFLPNYDTIIFDEVHLVKSQELTKIAKACTHANYRLGFTGTLPSVKLDLLNIKAYIGPLLREYGPGQLSEEGYISKCNINILNFSYDIDFDGEYDEIKKNVFQHKLRLRLLSDIANKADSNILILVGQVENEGEILFDYIKNKTDKTVVFLHGKSKPEDREFWRLECEKRKNIILIATYGIMSTGSNIPSLKYVILGSPFKSEIRVLQSIGRALRKHSDKINGAIIYDIIDDCKYLNVHGNKRIKYYKNESFSVNEYNLSTNDLLIDGGYQIP